MKAVLAADGNLRVRASATYLPPELSGARRQRQDRRSQPSPSGSARRAARPDAWRLKQEIIEAPEGLDSGQLAPLRHLGEPARAATGRSRSARLAHVLKQSTPLAAIVVLLSVRGVELVARP